MYAYLMPDMPIHDLEVGGGQAMGSDSGGGGGIRRSRRVKAAFKVAL